MNEYMKAIAIGWAAANAKPRAVLPVVPLHRGREYQNAATHGDSAAFRQRMIERGMKVRPA